MNEAGYMRGFIGLGGNIGPVYENIFKTLEFLDEKPGIEIVKISHIYKTPPWGGVEQDWFINACAELRFSLSPVSLLENCLEAENSLRRERLERWGPRTMDVDILYIDDFESNTEVLQVPHPRMQLRAFVLKPLSDLDDSLNVFGKNISKWLMEMDQGEVAQIERLAMDEDPPLGKAEWRMKIH